MIFNSYFVFSLPSSVVIIIVKAYGRWVDAMVDKNRNDGIYVFCHLFLTFFDASLRISITRRVHPSVGPSGFFFKDEFD